MQGGERGGHGYFTGRGECRLISLSWGAPRSITCPPVVLTYKSMEFRDRPSCRFHLRCAAGPGGRSSGLFSLRIGASAEDRGHLFAGSGGAGGDTHALMTDALMYLPRIHRAMCRACAQMLNP